MLQSRYRPFPGALQSCFLRMNQSYFLLWYQLGGTGSDLVELLGSLKPTVPSASNSALISKEVFSSYDIYQKTIEHPICISRHESVNTFVHGVSITLYKSGTWRYFSPPYTFTLSPCPISTPPCLIAKVPSLAQIATQAGQAKLACHPIMCFPGVTVKPLFTHLCF